MSRILSLISRSLRWLSFLIAVGAVLWLPVTVQASVTLVSFEASLSSEWARLDWETATEIDNAGFFLWRNTTGGTNSSSYTKIPVVDVATNLTTTFIPAKGDSLLGATYAYYDKNVIAGTTYYYLLEAVDFNNNSEFHGPVSITIAGVNPSPSPTLTSTPTFALTPTSSAPTNTSTSTNTPTHTLTPPPNIAPFNTVTPTPTQSFTPGPTITLTPTPTISPTPTKTLHPLDLTLTAVIAQVSPLPTYTPLKPTRTPFPTWTLGVQASSTPVPGMLEGIPQKGLLQLILAGLVILGSGGAFTVFLFLTRRGDRSTY